MKMSNQRKIAALEAKRQEIAMFGFSFRMS